MESKEKIVDQKRLRNSFKYAFEGIKTAYKEEQNLRVHTIAAILVVIASYILKLSTFEFSICLILIGLVLMAEFFNTAIENMVDMITLENNPYAKKAKDVAAAGVLIFVFFSSIIGVIIFLPKIIDLIKSFM